MTFEDRGKQDGSLSKLAFIITSQAIQAAEAPKPLLSPANTSPFRNKISAKWTDVAFPEFKQVLFFWLFHCVHVKLSITPSVISHTNSDARPGASNDGT
jgi:hypothetical protein